MGGAIRLRACLAVTRDWHILLVAHYSTDASSVQWLIPAGGVEYGEALEAAALREFREETGLEAECTGLLDVCEVIRRERPWHSVSVVFRGVLVGGDLQPEVHPVYGRREVRWFAATDLAAIAYHPRRAVERALATGEPGDGAPKSSSRSCSDWPRRCT